MAFVWLFRDDRLCRAEIRQQFGDVIIIQHTFASTEYNFVSPAWRDVWRQGMSYPSHVTCMTDFEGVSTFTKH